MAALCEYSGVRPLPERDLTERFGDGIALTGKGALPSVLRRFGSEHRHAAAGCRAVYADCADEQALVKLRRAAEAVSVKMSESKTDVSAFFMRRVSSSF